MYTKKGIKHKNDDDVGELDRIEENERFGWSSALFGSMNVLSRWVAACTWTKNGALHIFLYFY